jgi:anti-sigma factor RsiW
MASPGRVIHSACKILEADLVLLHYGELNDPERQAVQSHLQECLHCRDSLEQMAKLMPLTVQRDDPPTSFWTDYSRELRHKVDKTLERRSWRAALASWLKPIPIAALSACAVGLLALVFTVGKDYWSTPQAPEDDEVIVASPQDMDLLQHLDVLDALDVLEDMNSINDTV